MTTKQNRIRKLGEKTLTVKLTAEDGKKGFLHFPERLVEAALKVLDPLEDWAQRCHEASVELVCSPAFRALLPIPRDGSPRCRVARGACMGVGSQHSWVVLGPDVYEKGTPIIDPTLWSYSDAIEGIHVTCQDPIGPHFPHGFGSIFDWGKPERGSGETIELTPAFELSERAKEFLTLVGELDWEGWHSLLAKAPVVGWPASELMEAASTTQELQALVPIDRLGMNTRLNPGGLYLHGDDEKERPY